MYEWIVGRVATTYYYIINNNHQHNSDLEVPFGDTPLSSTVYESSEMNGTSDSEPLENTTTIGNGNLQLSQVSSSTTSSSLKSSTTTISSKEMVNNEIPTIESCSKTENQDCPYVKKRKWHLKNRKTFITALVAGLVISMICLICGSILLRISAELASGNSDVRFLNFNIDHLSGNQFTLGETNFQDGDPVREYISTHTSAQVSTFPSSASTTNNKGTSSSATTTTATTTTATTTTATTTTATATSTTTGSSTSPPSSSSPTEEGNEKIFFSIGLSLVIIGSVGSVAFSIATFYVSLRMA